MRAVRAGNDAAQFDAPALQVEVLGLLAQLLQAVALQQQTAAGHPRHPAAARRGQGVVLAPRPRQQQPCQRARQRRERTGRPLRRAVAVVQLQADDAGPRLRVRQLVGQGDDAVEKVEYLLTNESQRARIAAAGQKRTIRDHNFAGRVKTLANIIENNRQKMAA